ncbi:hypothetical protein H0H93_014081 [Arthromyces matolae]|nr:hypothetical protein H0H93_014081 [Arthromyces matolae]
MKKRNGGLRNDWNRPTAPQVQETLRAEKTVVLNSFNSQKNQEDTLRANREPEDSDHESIGGISDDTTGGQAEQARIVEDGRKPMMKGTKVKPLARVVDTSSVPEFVPGISTKILNQKSRRLGASGFGKKKAEIRITDVNETVRRLWDSSFKPRIIEYIGTLTPWQVFSEDDVATIQDIWAEVYPYEPRLETDARLNFIVTKLVDDIITAWLHKFSSTASQYLVSNIFKSDPRFSTPEGRQTWATWAMVRDLTNEELENAPEHSRRFYYREYEEPEDPASGTPIFKGIFQSPIIIATLASHFQWLERLHGSDRGEEFPTGALVLTIQACRHHISQWTTGHCVKPAGSLANFSAANWGDRRVHDGPSSVTDVRLTSDIVNAVEELSPKQRGRIIAAVTDYIKRQNRHKRVAQQAESTVKVTKPRFKLRDEDSESDANDTSVAAFMTAKAMDTTATSSSEEHNADGGSSDRSDE